VEAAAVDTRQAPPMMVVVVVLVQRVASCLRILQAATGDGEYS
jgi:hypothetical protein